MAQDKLMTLSRYLDDLKNKISETNVPDKHKHSPHTYREFLQREINRTTKKVDDLKMNAKPGK